MTTCNEGRQTQAVCCEDNDWTHRVGGTDRAAEEQARSGGWLLWWRTQHKAQQERQVVCVDWGVVAPWLGIVVVVDGEECGRWCVFCGGTQHAHTARLVVVDGHAHTLCSSSTTTRRTTTRKQGTRKGVLMGTVVVDVD